MYLSMHLYIIFIIEEWEYVKTQFKMYVRSLKNYIYKYTI